MARKKLNSFTVDDAGDSFTPTVKKINVDNTDDNMKREGDSLEPVKVEIKSEDKVNPSNAENVQNIKQNTKSEKTKKTANQVLDDNGVDVEKKINMESIQTKSPQPKIEAGKGTDVLVQLVGFCLGDEEFGVDIQKVQEINRMLTITRVPNTPDFVMGVINLRGKVIPVLSLRKRFDLPEKENDKNTRIVVVEIDSKTIGFVVDSVSEVIRLPSSTIEPPPKIVAGIDEEYISGVGKLEDRLLILLDLDKLLLKEMDQLKKAA